MYKDAFDGLIQLYTELEGELARKSLDCSGCGECCHFDTADHVLYASDLERQYLLETARTAPRPDGADDLLERGLRCPFQAGGRCEARDGRTLGCRLHFCRWPDAEEENGFCEKWHGKLKRLHDAFGLEWRYGPLLPLHPSNNK